MSRILGLDLGTNSIGWAIIDTDSNEIIECGARIIPISRRKIERIERTINSHNFFRKTFFLRLRELQKRTTLVVKILFACITTTISLTLINSVNWQYWFNISTMIFLSFLTILHQDKK